MHAHVRVEHESTVEADQQVLALGADPLDTLPSPGATARSQPEGLEPGHLTALEGRRERDRRAVDRVALGHAIALSRGA